MKPSEIFCGSFDKKNAYLFFCFRSKKINLVSWLRLKFVLARKNIGYVYIGCTAQAQLGCVEKSGAVPRFQRKVSYGIQRHRCVHFFQRELNK